MAQRSEVRLRIRLLLHQRSQLLQLLLLGALQALQPAPQHGEVGVLQQKASADQDRYQSQSEPSFCSGPFPVNFNPSLTEDPLFKKSD